MIRVVMFVPWNTRSRRLEPWQLSGNSAGLPAGWSGVRVPKEGGNLTHHRIQTGSGLSQPPIQSVPGALSLEVKRPRR